MDFKKAIGIATLILGIIFVGCSIFFREMLPEIMGLSVLCLGISAIFNGWNIRRISDNVYSNISLVIGVFLIVLGLMFMFSIALIALVSGFEFYIIGILFIIMGINGYLSNINHAHDFSSILTVIMGVFSIFLVVLASPDLVYVPILIGVVLIAEGFAVSISY